MELQPAWRWVVCVSAVIVAACIDWLTNGEAAVAYAIPVVFAAAATGWYGGMSVVLACSACLFGLSPHQSIATNALESFALLLIACVGVLTAGRERKLRLRYQQVAEQLSNVY